MPESPRQAIARNQRIREELEAEERALAAARIAAGPAGPYARRTGGGLTGALREGILQADAAARSLANTSTFGGADYASAKLNALPPSRPGLDYEQRFKANLANERARDAYDAIHRPGAQQLGQAGSILLSLAGPGPVVPARIPGAAGLSGRELIARLGVGGLTGMGVQTVVDAAARRNTDRQDAVGAALGGAVGAAFPGLDPAKAGAVGSALTSAAQDVLHGRPVSLADMGRSATAGRVVGAVAGAAGRRVSAALPRREKGRLGETLGAIRSAINQMDRAPGRVTLPVPGAKRGTVVDGVTHDATRFFEDKFGNHADLSKNQTKAQAKYGSDYVIYHFLPHDVGEFFGGLLGTSAGQSPRRRPRNGS